MSYISTIKNVFNNKIFYEISKSEEGINFERQIIFDLIINNPNIKKVKIEQIYSVEKFPDITFENNKEYLFIQKKSNAPYYDFAYIYYSDDLTILKCSQIGINKGFDELIKLNKEFLLLDLAFFCQKFFYETKIKIHKVEICIITTYNAFEEYKNFLEKKIGIKNRKYNNFEVMKNFCFNNKYTFLIFDTKTSEFYKLKSDNKLQKENLTYSYNQFDIQKIFVKNKYIQQVKKLNYYYNPKKPKIIGKIQLPKDFQKGMLNANLNFQIEDNIAIFKKIKIKKEEDINNDNNEIEIDEEQHNKIIENESEKRKSQENNNSQKFKKDNFVSNEKSTYNSFENKNKQNIKKKRKRDVNEK